MLIHQSIQDLMSIGKHAVGEKEGRGIMWAWRVGREQREESRNRVIALRHFWTVRRINTVVTP